MSRIRSLWPLLIASLVLNAMYGAFAGVLVPAQVAIAEPANKELVLAAIMTASSLLTIAAHPIAGALSDRTRSRWGRRKPWVVGASLASALVMVWLGEADAVWAIALGWLVLQPLLNAVEAPLDAVVADRVERRDRPRAAASYGASAAVGLALGAAVAGVWAATPAGLSPWLAAALLAAAIVFAVAMPQRAPHPAGRSAHPHPLPRPTAPIPARRATQPLLATLRIPRFRLVFIARFLLVLGQHLVMGYLLYAVIAMTGASVGEAGGAVSLLIGSHIAAVVLGALVGSRFIGSRRVPWVIGGSVTIAAALLVPIALPNLWGLAVFAVVGGIGRGVYLSADLALMIDVLPSPGDHGRDLGVFGLATIVPQVLAPALAGVVLTVSGGAYAVLFGLASLCVLASVPVIARIGRSGASSSP
ncbi:MFS transporter [Pseudoclavibacter endophyticus]|uniref:MFS transporter n=1 Tax=Pseudoclavibacter endophyticus TaxID=1778590 RepID=UPI0016663FE8|nr:MFS transporter [Pseudoclavibacter endophyticus]GGA71190.1 MFS transporter [Pseudoclavibacter endophyticus]